MDFRSEFDAVEASCFFESELKSLLPRDKVLRITFGFLFPKSILKMSGSSRRAEQPDFVSELDS